MRCYPFSDVTDIIYRIKDSVKGFLHLFFEIFWRVDMYYKFKALLEKNGVSAYKVAKDLGFSQSLFPEWKSGKSTPKQDKIQKIADYFGVPITYFYGHDNLDVDFATPDGVILSVAQGKVEDVETTKRLLNYFLALSKKDQSMVMDFVERLSQLEDKGSESND